MKRKMRKLIEWLGGPNVAALLLVMTCTVLLSPAFAQNEISDRVLKVHTELFNAGVGFVGIGIIWTGLAYLFWSEFSRGGLATLALGAAMIFGSLDIANFLKT